MKKLTVLAAVAGSLLLSACAGWSTLTGGDESAKLHALFDAQWQRELKENPITASLYGDRRYNDRWGELTLAAIEASHQADQADLEAARRINRDALEPADQLNLDLFIDQMQQRIQAHPFQQYLIPLNQRGGIQTADELAGRLRFSNEKDYADWNARLAALPKAVDQHIEIMRVGMARGIVPPKVIMERVPAQIEKQLVERAEDSGFYAPYRKAEPTSAHATQARELIQNQVLPAYQRFARFFNEEYLPACRDTVGAWALPNGRAFYDYRVAHYTTTTLSADEIHQIGLDEVARIRSLMDEVIAEVEFKGSFAEFLHFLRTDPQFYFETGEEILREYRNIAKRIDPQLVKLFGKLPRMPYGVKAIPAASAPDTTTAYYFPPAADGSRAGYFYANLYRPEVRPKYEMEALTVHEAMPGHHLQIALAQELGDLPAFRRFNGYTAFVEGWGLYSESLGSELGLYTDPYSRFGQLTYEMWRAVRLVVDTGLHAKGWSRQQAIDFFKENAGKAEHDIINEIDRYIAWPGQALAYKIGELKIQALRKEAEAALSERFDIRGFHDTVLGAGAIPLNLLERNVRAWIQQQSS